MLWIPGSMTNLDMSARYLVRTTGPVEFRLSRSGSWITGAILHVDGGNHLSLT